MSKIIVSYRRSDSAAITGRIFDRLVDRYGEESVFMDIDRIPFGTDFRHHIQDALRGADVLLAVIGPTWLGKTADGRTRIQDEADPVRVEIDAALKQGLAVIPVLVDNATMPGGARRMAAVIGSLAVVLGGAIIAINLMSERVGQKPPMVGAPQAPRPPQQEAAAPPPQAQPTPAPGAGTDRHPGPRRRHRHRARRVSCGRRQHPAVVPGDVARPVRLDLELLHRR
jgi:hypothetical protein